MGLEELFLLFELYRQSVYAIAPFAERLMLGNRKNISYNSLQSKPINPPRRLGLAFARAHTLNTPTHRKQCI